MAEYYKITDRLVPVTWEECQKAPEETYLARLTRKENRKISRSQKLKKKWK